MHVSVPLLTSCKRSDFILGKYRFVSLFIYIDLFYEQIC